MVLEGFLLVFDGLGRFGKVWEGSDQKKKHQKPFRTIKKDPQTLKNISF